MDEAIDGASFRVLVADDNEVAQRLCKRVLEKAGYPVLIAADGLQAVDIALRERPELILMDVAMPGLDGWRRDGGGLPRGPAAAWPGGRAQGAVVRAVPGRRLRQALRDRGEDAGQARPSQHPPDLSLPDQRMLRIHHDAADTGRHSARRPQPRADRRTRPLPTPA